MIFTYRPDRLLLVDNFVVVNNLVLAHRLVQVDNEVVNIVVTSEELEDLNDISLVDMQAKLDTPVANSLALYNQQQQQQR